MQNSRPREVWRVCKGQDLLVCYLRVVADVVVDGIDVVILRNGDDFLRERHPHILAAEQRADALRQQFLAEGWTGVFDR